ncbi:flagellar basal body-associated protein FliL [Marinospirillum sp.]|uniref:flagellar basal body-associated FliL family protein n=1 Tax=Marinospirillum sp. TaxID=2183934 RepID=UPI00384C8BAC
MADEEGGKSKKLIMIGGLVIGIAIILALAVGGTLYFLDRDSSEESEGGGVPGLGNSDIQLGTASYYSFEEAFVTPLISSDRKQRFMQLSLAVKGDSTQVTQAIETHMPRIKNDLNRLFTGQDYQTLQTPEGKMQLQNSAEEVVQKVVAREGVQIDQVLITNFVLQ